MNDFQVSSKLGEGAYSIVHKVRRLVDGNIYALKRVKILNLSEKEKLNALNEVRILASVKSNYVISYKEAFYDENDNVLAIVMEYADKGDLYQKICEFKKASVNFEESDIWRIFIQILKGLKALHEMKILHRDLKSANVFLFNDGCAKLGDLNVSKVARRGLGYTQTGTPYYASPEVWKDQPYDSKSDLWSLGCVLYEMITLRPPFRAENMEGLYNRVIKGQYSRISDRYSSDLQEIVRLLIQVQPEARPSCDQLLKNPIIMKRMDFFKNIDDNEESSLLQTIRVPKNLLFLTDKLPQANYEKIPNKRNLSFTNNKSELPDIHGKNLHRNKKTKRPEKKEAPKEYKKEYSEKQQQDNKDRISIQPNNDANNDEDNNAVNNKKIDRIIDEEHQEETKKKRVAASLDHSHLSGGNKREISVAAAANNNHNNIKAIKNSQDNIMDINSSIVREREKSPVNVNEESKRKMKEASVNNLPSIKSIASVEYIKYDDNRSARNKEEYHKKKKAEELKNIAKMMPYVNNEHISNIYKILAPPYIKNNLSIQNASASKNSGSIDKNSLKNLQKYYEYAGGQNYKIKKSNNNPTYDLNVNYASANIKIVPNRKLSPINNPMNKMIRI